MIKKSIRLHVTGKTEHGKSYWVKNTLIPLLAEFKPVIVFDRKGEYAGDRAKDVPGEWEHYGNIYEFYSMMEKNGGIPKDVHVVTCRSDDDYKLGFTFFYTMAEAHLKGGFPVSIVVEEAHDLLKSKDFGNIKRLLIQLARHGRHEFIDLVLISQRTLDVPTDIRSQLAGYVSFHQAYEGDRKALVQEGYTQAEKLIDLQPRKYLAFGEIPEHLSKIKKGATHEVS